MQPLVIRTPKSSKIGMCSRTVLLARRLKDILQEVLITNYVPKLLPAAVPLNTLARLLSIHHLHQDMCLHLSYTGCSSRHLHAAAAQPCPAHCICSHWHQQRVEGVRKVAVLAVWLSEQRCQQQHDGEGPCPAGPAWRGCCQLGECRSSVALSKQGEAVQHEVGHVAPGDDAPAAVQSRHK